MKNKLLRLLRFEDFECVDKLRVEDILRSLPMVFGLPVPSQYKPRVSVKLGYVMLIIGVAGQLVYWYIGDPVLLWSAGW